MEYTYNKILYSYKKAMPIDTWSNIDEIHNHYEQKKPDTKVYTFVSSQGNNFTFLLWTWTELCVCLNK